MFPTLILGWFTLICILDIAFCQNDKQWVWEKNSRSNKLQDDSVGSRASARYEISEPDDRDYDYDRPSFRPQRPLGGSVLHGPVGQIIGGGYFPNQGPGINRPLHYPGQTNYPNYPGRPPVQKFDTCSCTEKFNCRSPGLSYGHCDVGKSYCCYNKHGGLELGPAPSRPIHSPENGILVGPGYGARPEFNQLENFQRPYPRPFDNRPPYNPPQGILVGPGGPTSIIGRPGYPGGLGGLRPIHSAENGILVGPGGPYDRPPNFPQFGTYPRSSVEASEILSDESDSKETKKA